MTDPLTPEAAADIAGVPAAQLRAWAYDRVGPRNVGSRHRPLYRVEDIQGWLKYKFRERPSGITIDGIELTFNGGHGIHGDE